MKKEGRKYTLKIEKTIIIEYIFNNFKTHYCECIWKRHILYKCYCYKRLVMFCHLTRSSPYNI